MGYRQTSARKQSLAVGCACVGILVAATRSGWLSIFMAVAVVPQMVLLPAFILATLVAYLLVTNRPQLIAPKTPEPERAAAT